MIKLEKLKQGDVLTDSDGSTHIFMGLNPDHNDSCEVIVLSNSDYGLYYDTNEPNKLKMSYVLQQVTSWKRDGVELLKQEPEQEEFVFCPIEKIDGIFFFNVDDCLGRSKGLKHELDDLRLLETYGDYTFIGYSKIKSNGGFYSNCRYATPIYRNIDGEFAVYPYAVFMLTSKLNVGG